MSKINLLKTNELNDKIRKMFSDERKQLIIVSPYNFIGKDIIKLLSESNAKKYFIYRTPKKKKDKEDIYYIKSNLKKNIDYFEIKNLHAKAYISLEYSIITSLNLNESSMKNNFELGVLFDNKINRDLYITLLNQLEELLKENNYRIDLFNDVLINLYDEYNTKREVEGKKIIYNMRLLFRAIMTKSGKNWETDNPNNKAYKEICSKIYDLRKFSEKEYRNDRITLLADKIFKEEDYLYLLKNIKI